MFICLELNFVDGDDVFTIRGRNDGEGYEGTHRVTGSAMENTIVYDTPLDALEGMVSRIKNLHE